MKRILIVAGAVLGVLILILILIPLLVSANTFRPRLESVASQALGRKVQIGNLNFPLSAALLQPPHLHCDQNRPCFLLSPFGLPLQSC
jgi:hypothetical protein